MCIIIALSRSHLQFFLVEVRFKGKIVLLENAFEGRLELCQVLFIIGFLLQFHLEGLFHFGQVVLEVLSTAVDPLDS